MFAVSKNGWQPLLSRDRRDRLTGKKQESGLKHNDHIDLLACEQTKRGWNFVGSTDIRLGHCQPESLTGGFQVVDLGWTFWVSQICEQADAP